MTIDTFASFTLSGASITNPTSLQIGPDGRLYVAEQQGGIKVFSIEAGSGGYAVTSTETIDLVQTIPNHNDNGALNTGVFGRQVTGLLVTEDAAGNPVIFVGSSDPRIGAGSSGIDKNIDTNSGIITRLTQNASGEWEGVDIIRGLPRSEENHSVNGLEYDAATNELYFAVGGNTNVGAPSNNFANTPEYALATAILKVDLDTIDALPVKLDAQSGRNYVYDLPTLDDPTRANDLTTGLDLDPTGSFVADPWGGNNGMNQAKWVEDGPVQVYATGFRNAYDLVIHSNGKIYTVDNGANNGWGGRPLTPGNGVVTNDGQIATDKPSNDSGTEPDGAFNPNNLDNLHVVTGAGQYFGHPNPIRAWGENAVYDPSNPAAGPFNPKWTGIPVDLADVAPDLNGGAAGLNPEEGVFIQPGQGDGALFTWQVSTNGIVEYTSTADPTLTGALLTVGLNGNLTVLPVSADGLSVGPAAVRQIGGATLDVWAQGDGDPFAGTIWLAQYGTNAITILSPNGDPGTGQIPADRDEDGIIDTLDRMPVDPHNGTQTIINGGQKLVWAFDGQNPPGPLADFYQGAGFTGFGNQAGFTGIMKSDGELPEDLYDPNDIIAQGAANVFQVDVVTPGDAINAVNSQESAFFFGVKAATNVDDLIYTARMANPLNTINDSFQSQGIFIGTGDEDNYLKLVVGINGAGKPIIQVGQEVAGVFTSTSYALTIPAGSVTASDLFTVKLVIDAATGVVTPVWSYTLGGQATTVNGNGAAIQLQGATLAALQGSYTVQGQTSALGYGIISTSTGATPFAALWDELTVEATPKLTGPQGAAKIVVNQDAPLANILSTSSFNAGSFKITNKGQLDIANIEIDLSTASLPDLVFDPNDGTPAGDTVTKGFTVNVAGNSGVIVPANINGTPPFADPRSNGYNKLLIDFAAGGFNTNETMTFSVDVDPTSIQGQAGSGSPGAVSGLELTGATVKITYADGTVQTGQIFGDGNGGGESYLNNSLAGALTLKVGNIGNGGTGTLATATQALVISGGPAGATVRVMVIEGAVDSIAANPPTNLTDPDFDANTADKVTYFSVTLGANGGAVVNITSALAVDTDARYYVNAVVVADLDAALPGLEAAGRVGDAVNFVIKSGFTPPNQPNGDEDGDGILNKNDPFAKSALNGAGNDIGYGLEFNGSDPTTGLFGFTGLLTNGIQSYTQQYNQPINGAGSPVSQTSVGGGYLAITNISDGDTLGNLNDQENAFQFGLDTEGEAVTIETAFLNPFKSGGTNYQQLGLQIGAGNQNNFVKFVFGKNGSNQFQLGAENAGAWSSINSKLPAGVTFAAVDYIKLFLDIEPNGGNPTATARYELYAGTAGAYTKIGEGSAGTVNLDGTSEAAFEGAYTLNGNSIGLSVGVIATSTTGGVNGTDQPYTAQWDYLRTYSSSDSTPPAAELAPTPNLTTATSVAQTLVVTYSDPSGIDLASLGGGDLTVNGPAAVGAFGVTLDSYAVAADGVVTAIYKVAPPGGGWNTADNGTYIVNLNPGQVLDLEGNAVGVVNELGGFEVAITQPLALTSLLVNRDSTNIDAQTVPANTLRIENKGLVTLTKVVIDLSETTIPDTLFDPLGKPFTVNQSNSVGRTTANLATGSPPFGDAAPGGFKTLTLDFTDFNGGEVFNFSLDIDPYELSGAELTGAKVTVTYADGRVHTGQIFADGSLGGGEAYATGGLAAALDLQIGTLENGETGTLTSTNQTLDIAGGPAGATVRVAVITGSALTGSGGRPLTDPVYGTNDAADIDYFTVKLDADGQTSVNLAAALVADTDARFYVNAVVVGNIDPALAGFEAAGLVGDPIAFKIDTDLLIA